ncbi:MAG: hypothetical protein HYS13_08330 [Planctomycetia bacterium]|nr:hypothetical protein [Planctomycetia bacterium]
MAEVQAPYCVAMVLCSVTHRDPYSGNYTLVGTFKRLAAPSFPARGRFSVYLAFSDGIGDVPLTFTISHARAAFDDSGPGVIFTRRFSWNFADLLQVVDGVLGVQVEFPEPGTYHCEVHVRDTVLLSRRMNILQK